MSAALVFLGGYQALSVGRQARESSATAHYPPACVTDHDRRRRSCEVVSTSVPPKLYSVYLYSHEKRYIYKNLFGEDADSVRICEHVEEEGALTWGEGCGRVLGPHRFPLSSCPSLIGRMS